MQRVVVGHFELIMYPGQMFAGL